MCRIQFPFHPTEYSRNKPSQNNHHCHKRMTGTIFTIALGHLVSPLRMLTTGASQRFSSILNNRPLNAKFLHSSTKFFVVKSTRESISIKVGRNPERKE